MVCATRNSGEVLTTYCEITRILSTSVASTTVHTVDFVATANKIVLYISKLSVPKTVRGCSCKGGYY